MDLRLTMDRAHGGWVRVGNTHCKHKSLLGLAVWNRLGQGAGDPKGPAACFLLDSPFLSEGRKRSPRAGGLSWLQMQKDSVLICIFHLHIFP